MCKLRHCRQQLWTTGSASQDRYGRYRDNTRISANARAWVQTLKVHSHVDTRTRQYSVLANGLTVASLAHAGTGANAVEDYTLQRIRGFSPAHQQAVQVGILVAQ